MTTTVAAAAAAAAAMVVVHRGQGQLSTDRETGKKFCRIGLPVTAWLALAEQIKAKQSKATSNTTANVSGAFLASGDLRGQARTVERPRVKRSFAKTSVTDGAGDRDQSLV